MIHLLRQPTKSPFISVSSVDEYEKSLANQLVYPLYQPLYKIFKERVICVCDEYEAESLGEDHSLIPCYACRKMQELLIQLHEDGFVK
jgi:hypothetical protein